MGKTISWGKCRIIYRKKGDTKWAEFPTPVLNSTQLQTTKGEKTEAKIEGGENEAVRYARNTYMLQAGMRLAVDTKKPVDDQDGVIADIYEVGLIPENAAAPGILMQSANMSLEDTFNTQDGAILTYAWDAMSEEGDQLKWGKFNVTETKAGDISTATALTFQEVAVQGGAAPAAINLMQAKA